MAELNKVLMIGRLTRDPELRYTPGGMGVAELRLAVNHTYRTKEEKREETCFIDVSILGRGAEVAKEYLSKGREVFIEGRLQFDSWEKDGQKRSKHKVVADRFQFMGGRNENRSGGTSYQDPESFDPGPSAAPQREAAAGDDDLPF